jgi:hypothetical protein
MRRPGRSSDGRTGPGPRHRPSRAAPRTARTDRNPAVDRETARRNMTAGLVAGGFAAVVFALCFIVALLYIAHG